MTKPKTLKFEPSARIQGLFGRELISNDYVAIAEVVRNAYDAGAKAITITLKATEPQKITILDNGSGMSTQEFENAWMRPGYSKKKDLVKQGDRHVLGEKGIGRFAVDKLAEKVRITTKKGNRSPITALFDWTRFEDQNKYLKNIKISVQEVEDEELITQKQGTRLELTDLRKIWAEKDWLNLRRELKNLLLPVKSTQQTFKIIANCNNWESGYIEPNFNGEGSYNYYFSITKEGEVIWSLTRPDKIIEKLKAEGVSVKKNSAGTDLIDNTFGLVKGRFYFFDKPAAIKKQDYDYGVGIYRDDFRVEPYGRKNDDWLGVKSKRASRQGHAPVTPSKLFGYIEISRENNPNLKDLTNREGIQESDEFKSFQEKIKERFSHFSEFIAEDNKKLPKSASYQAQKRGGVRLTKAQTVGEMADQLAHQLKQPMSVISTTTETLKLYLETHKVTDQEIEKFIERIQTSISRLNSNIEDISELSQDLRKPETDFDLVELLKDFLDKHKPNFEAKGVSLNLELDLSDAKIRFSQAALKFTLENYLDNALEITTNSTNSRAKEVNIKLEKKDNKIRVSVRDFGDGIPKAKEKSLFSSPVASENGSGSGLYFCKLRVEPFGGELNFERLNDGTVFYIEIQDENRRN